MSDLTSSSLRETFLAPLLALVSSCRSTRDCPDLSDEQLLRVSLLRALSPQESGRDFLQSLRDIHGIDVERSQFFDTIKSPRRLGFVEEISHKLRLDTRLQLLDEDPLASFPELEGREVFAGDGHYIEHACHDPRSQYEGKPYVAIGHFFALDLRTHWLHYLDLGGGEQAKKKHDMAVMKKVCALLKVDGKKGTIWVWDKGGIDFRFWHNQKQSRGVYFISRLKENMKPIKCGDLTWDKDDPRNEGVCCDELVGVGTGACMRVVTYVDPETGKEWKFITSDLTLPPGIIVHLYRLRWNIEKVFDETENKLHENKGWGTSPTAKRLQAHLIALAHNLMLLLETKVRRDHGIRDEKVEKKYEKQLCRREEVARQEGRRLPRMIRLLRRRATQFSRQFIRWLRNHLNIQASYEASLPALRSVMASYL